MSIQDLISRSAYGPLWGCFELASPESQNWPNKKFGGSAIISAQGVEIISAQPEVEDMLSIEIDDGVIKSARSLKHSIFWKSSTAHNKAKATGLGIAPLAVTNESQCGYSRYVQEVALEN